MSEPLCFVIAIGFSCAYFVNVDEEHGGYLKDALVFESRSAAESYVGHPWMVPFLPCHVAEVTRAKIEENRAMHERLANASLACCPHPVERHAYNGCADCGCSVGWPEHPDREHDPEFAAIIRRRTESGISTDDLHVSPRKAGP